MTAVGGNVPDSSSETEVTAVPLSREILNDLAARHGRPVRLGCSLVAHRDLGFCSYCITNPGDAPLSSASTELTGWRLLAMAERGIPNQPKKDAK